LAEARPLAFNPPVGLLPSFLCQAGDLAISVHLAGLVAGHAHTARRE
jgi:hypothetical protein